MHAKRDTYQTVTDAILAALATCGPCERPWAGPKLTMPMNAITGHKYRGSNIVMLWIAAQDAGYTESRWATFRQWAEKGANVRKGEKGTPVLWFKMLDRKDDAGDAQAGEEGGKKIPCARLSWVFNIAQVEGYEDTAAKPAPVDPVEAIAQADALLAASGARITHAGRQAFYRPSSDEIMLPPRHTFTGTSTSSATESYYAVALHELVHWTGKRLDRQLAGRFGTQAYAAEELVAELGAAFLCAELGITSEPRADHAAYLASWAKLLADDRRAFITAAAKAAQASDYLLALMNPVQWQQAA